jgi:integrase
MVLGSTAMLAAHDARSQAQSILAQVKLGGDPAREKQARQDEAEDTIGKLLPRFLDWQRQRLKPRSFIETNRHLVQHAARLHRLPIRTLDRRAVATLLSELTDNNGPGAANRTRGSLSAFCSWAIREGYIDANPVSYTNKAIETGARERVLTDAELARIWRACGDDPYGVVVKLLMLTGARREEIGGLRWSEVDLDEATITLPPPRTKNKREHVIPLVPMARDLIAAQPRRIDTDGSPCDLVFGRGQRGRGDWSGSRADLDTRIAATGKPLTAWVLHDLRRTLSTALHGEPFKVPPHVVETLLGHVSGHKAGVAGVYNRAPYLDERRRALTRWARHITALVSGELSTAEVVTLRRKRR